MCDSKEVEFSLKVMINKEKTKVLFAEVDSHFADILLSFLTLPLGRIIKVLNNHYGDDKAASIGSLSSLYHSLVNLDSSHFWTEGAKHTLLNPRSSIEDEYKRLKLNIAEFQPTKYFCCSHHSKSNRFPSVSVYYDNIATCNISECGDEMIEKEENEKGCKAASGDGVFTINTTSFIITDDLSMLPSETGLFGIIINLGITDADKAEASDVTFGFTEILGLLKASLISQTPLSDLILNISRQTNLVARFESETSFNQIENDQTSASKKMILKVVTQISTGKLLYVQAKDDFIDFLFSFLYIPLGGVKHLLAGRACVKAVNNLYRSITHLIDDEYFKTPNTKDRLMKPNVTHGCISDNHMLPLTEESLPDTYREASWFSSAKFPNGKGHYLKGPRTYHVTDDLTVTPFCFVSILSSLNKQKIAIYDDVKEVELQIGLKEGLSILKASLTSTSALSDTLLNHTSLKQPKAEIKV
ncbi:hypothetical protein AAHA92_10978 [Salvia divinorum]|uniref:DUF674 family protein n=1 Tax=Salvia divinorum TaxID=28513 RepID=A0ABD1HWF3_SALDI